MLTIKEIRSLKPGEWRSDGGARGTGTLVFHASTSGKISAYFRHAPSPAKRYDLPLGMFDDTGRMGDTLADLRARAGKLSKLYQSGIKNLREYLDQQEASAQAAEIASRAAEEAVKVEQAAAKAIAEREAKEREWFNLQALCTCYADNLERLGKTRTARDVRSLFKVHIFEADEKLSATPARDITTRELTTLIRKTREKGHERTAGMLRSYLNAAYSLAINAEGDTDAPANLIDFAIENNPVQSIRAIPVKHRDRTLSQDELRIYLKKLGCSLVDQALKLALYAGGQRSEQLIRVRISDFDTVSGVLKLMDAKGRRLQAREHRLPLGPTARAITQTLAEKARITQPEELDPPLFASGKVSLYRSTLSHRIKEISQEMQGPPFTLRDIRRTVETMLASMGISRDVRAQLLSHGLSGVQQLHYDRHSYMSEKADALIRWEQYLEGLNSTAQVDDQMVP